MRLNFWSSSTYTQHWCLALLV